LRPKLAGIGIFREETFANIAPAGAEIGKSLTSFKNISRILSALNVASGTIPIV